MHYNSDELLKRVKFLEEELYLTQHQVLNLVPHELSVILSSYRDCNNRKETYQWIDRIAHKIIEQAEVNSHGWQDTALCHYVSRVHSHITQMALLCQRDCEDIWSALAIHISAFLHRQQ